MPKAHQQASSRERRNVLTGDRADRCPDTLRLVRAVDSKTGDIIDLLTNNLELGASMLRMNLFTHRNLLEWLDDPYGSPPLEPVPEQLSLNL
jgi:hypothetical protein